VTLEAANANPTLFAHPQEINGRPVAWQPLKGFQTRCMQVGAFECLLGGAAGPGKTDVLIALAAKYAHHPKARVIFFRTVYKDTLDIRDRMQALYPLLGFQWDATNNRWQSPHGGTVQIAHAKTLAEITDYLGPEYTAVMWDELSLVPDEVVWQMILGRIRSTDPTVPLRARASANPIGPGRSWLKTRFVDVCGRDGKTVFRDEDSGRTRAYVPGTAADNPLLPADYWKGLSDLPPSVQAALRNGDWDMALGLFYPELMETSHVLIQRDDLPKLEEWHEWWAAADWGYSHPCAVGFYVRVGNLVIKLDTLYMHRFQDEEQAATIKGHAKQINAMPALRMVYGGSDFFAQRQAHVAAAETVAMVWNRYGIHVERANQDKLARAQVMRRMFAPLVGPVPDGQVRFAMLDTPGNRRCLSEFQALVPDELNPKVPAKRDANERGLNGDDGADETSFALATPSLEPTEPLPLYQYSNVTDGKAEPAPWERAQAKFRMPDEEGRVDRREYVYRQGLDSSDSQFGGWGA
jgi:hypothetical protein